MKIQTGLPNHGGEDSGREPSAVLEIPMRLLGRTVNQTRLAMARLTPGAVLRLQTNDP